MNIGFFIFDSQEEYERKKRMFDETSAVEDVYAGGDENSFPELMETVASSGDTIYMTSLKDFGNTFQQLLKGFEYVQENDIKLILLEGVQNEMLMGTLKGAAAKAAKTFMRLLESGQLS